MDDLSAWSDIINNVRPRWMRDALCREHPEVTWFPERGGTGREARAICARCLVRDECRTYATEHREHGVWGGTSETERAAMTHAA